MSAADLRAAAKRSANAKQASRILAIAMVLDGFSREEAARLCGMDRQTLRDWVHRYNKEGLAGLADKARSGRPTSLSWVEQGKFASWVEEGADLARDGVVRFRRVDLRDRIAAEFGVSLHERSVGKLQPAIRSRSPGNFQKNFASLAKEALGERAHDEQGNGSGRRGRMAQFTKAGRAREYRFAEVAPLCARAEPCRKHLGIPSRQRAEPSSLGNVREYRRCMLHRMERLDAHPRHHSLNRNPRLGARQKLRPLVLSIRFSTDGTDPRQAEEKAARGGGCSQIGSPGRSRVAADTEGGSKVDQPAKIIPGIRAFAKIKINKQSGFDFH